MVNSVRHRRSPARSINLLIPMTSPSQESPDENGSGQAKAPEDGYSALVSHLEICIADFSSLLVYLARPSLIRPRLHPHSRRFLHRLKISVDHSTLLQIESPTRLHQSSLPQSHHPMSSNPSPTPPPRHLGHDSDPLASIKLHIRPRPERSKQAGWTVA